MALDGRGLAWLPQLLVGEDIEGGQLVVAASEDWCIDLEIRLYRDRAALGKAAEGFWLAAQEGLAAG
jgi:DNA-binding transcriptional LysR family regulator